MSCEFCLDPDARPVVVDSSGTGEVTVLLCREHREAFAGIVVGPAPEVLSSPEFS